MQGLLGYALRANPTYTCGDGLDGRGPSKVRGGDHEVAHRSVGRRDGAVRGRAVPAGRAADRLAGGVRLHRSRAQFHARQFRHFVHRSGVRRAARHDARHCRVREPDLLRGGGADGLDGGAHRHAAATGRAPAGDGLVRDSAVPRRHRLGAAGGAQQRAAQPALPRGHGRRARHGAVQHLHAAGADLRHLVLHVSLRVRASRQRARPHPRRPRGRLLHAGRQRLAHGARHHHPAGAAGAGRGGAGRLPAGHDAVWLAGDPGAAGGLPHHDDEDLEPVPVSAQARASGRCRPAAAGADGGAAAGASLRAGPARLRAGGGKKRGAAARAARLAADTGAARLPRHAVPARVPALRGAHQRRVLAHPLPAADAGDF